MSKGLSYLNTQKERKRVNIETQSYDNVKQNRFPMCPERTEEHHIRE